MSTVVEVKSILNKLCGPSKLERDRAESLLTEEMKNYSDYSDIISWIDSKLSDKQSLHTCLGCLTAFKILLKNCTCLTSDYLNRLSNECIIFHQHDEYRVRMLAGECMGELCHILGVVQFIEFIGHIKQGIVTSLINSADRSTESSMVNKEKVLHNIDNCKSLETWIRCFQSTINGLGTSFEDVVDQEMLTIIFETVEHNNRFVRDSGFELIGTVAELHGYSRNTDCYINACEQLCKGLSDNWSEVRMTASIAARKFLLAKTPLDVTETEVFKRLLPRLCLNRYYPAEGVRLYNQESWRIIVGDRGKELIEQHIHETVDFYTEQCGASNHDARESACASISELAVKLNKEIVLPFVRQLLSCLVLCLTDDIWSVRDVSCMACARLVAAFPDQATQYRHDALIPLFLANVVDDISSVREGGAVSVALVLRALNSEESNYLKKVLDFIYENLENVKDQNVVSCSISTADKNSRRMFDAVQVNVGQYADDKKHDTSKDIVDDKCTDMLWERADGCILLIAELSLHVPQSHQHMSTLLNAVINALSYRHYQQHVYLLATASSIVIKLYEGLGKQKIKIHLNCILDIIDVSLKSNCPVSMLAAEESLSVLSSKLGVNILRGRIEMHSSELLDRTNHLL